MSSGEHEASQKASQGAPAQPDIDEILSAHFWYNATEKHLDHKGAKAAIQSLLVAARIDEVANSMEAEYKPDPTTHYLTDRLAELRAAQQALLEGRV